jgi:hypothetical protein
MLRRGHITNRSEDDFFNEILRAEKRLTDAAAAGHRTREAQVIDLCKLFDTAETPIQDLTTSDGTSIWAGDGVHLTSPAYRVAARLLMAELERADHGEAGEQDSRVSSRRLRRRQQSRRLSSRRRRRNLSSRRSGSPDSYRRGLPTTTRAAGRAATMVG